MCCTKHIFTAGVVQNVVQIFGPLSTHNDTAWEFYQKYPEWNYLLTKKKCESLKKTSVVNLKLINKAEPMGKYLFAVSDQVLKDLIRRFKEWQNENPDPLYEEIKDII